jgi:hypothetical protein
LAFPIVLVLLTATLRTFATRSPSENPCRKDHRRIKPPRKRKKKEKEKPQKLRAGQCKLQVCIQYAVRLGREGKRDGCSTKKLVQIK